MLGGIRCVVGESFGEIFFGNCVAMGVPAVTASESDVAALMDAVELDPSQDVHVDLEALVLQWRGGSARIGVPEGARRQLLDGSWNAMATLLESRDEIRAMDARLPYPGRWS